MENGRLGRPFSIILVEDLRLHEIGRLTLLGRRSYNGEGPRPGAYRALRSAAFRAIAPDRELPTSITREIHAR